MKITPLYPSKNTVLTTAQVLAERDESSYDLEASLQFVNGPHAVEFDFSVFCYKNTERDREAIREELAALDALVLHVNDFQKAFHEAANKALEFLG